MIKKLFKEYKQQQIALFVVKAVLLYIVWFILLDFLFEQDGVVNTWLNYRVATDASYVLDIFGLNGGTIPGIHQTRVMINGNTMVGVGNPCNGLELFALFAGFIICFPGNAKTKLWFIPLGFLLIHLSNIIRTAILAFIQYKAPQYLDFNHHYTFTVIVYAIIFFLWMKWVNSYSGFNFTSENEKSN